MVQSSGILNISTLKGSYRIGGRLWVQALIGSNQIVYIFILIQPNTMVQRKITT
jgi:hypothetical protein